MARDSRVAGQDVFVELAPEQFIDPGDHPGVATFEFALIAHQRAVQALARRDHPGGEVRGELTSAGFGRQVALFVVVTDLLVGKGFQALMGFGLTSGPQMAQAFVWGGETGHGSGHSVTADGHWLLLFRQQH